MKHLLKIILLVCIAGGAGCASKPIDTSSSSIITKQEYICHGYLPQDLEKVTKVYWNDLTCLELKAFNDPNPEDPDYAALRVNTSYHFFHKPAEEIKLPFSLDEALTPNVSERNNTIVGLARVEVIATGESGEKWLLYIRLQDIKVDIYKLRMVCGSSPIFEGLYYQDYEQGYYESDSKLLHDFFLDIIEKRGKENPAPN